ncbi:MAG: DinB family protein, partial [Planctomycetota bacterium]
QNVGHLIDLDGLPVRRLAQILAGEPTLIAADISNRGTNDADHNARRVADLLAEFRRNRLAGVARFEAVAEADRGRSAIHPRLRQPMRIVDILYFDSEHDDYHLARVGELLAKFHR